MKKALKIRQNSPNTGQPWLAAGWPIAIGYHHHYCTLKTKRPYRVEVHHPTTLSKAHTPQNEIHPQTTLLSVRYSWTHYFSFHTAHNIRDEAATHNLFPPLLKEPTHQLFTSWSWSKPTKAPQSWRVSDVSMSSNQTRSNRLVLPRPVKSHPHPSGPNLQHPAKPPQASHAQLRPAQSNQTIKAQPDPSRPFVGLTHSRTLWGPTDSSRDPANPPRDSQFSYP